MSQSPVEAVYGDMYFNTTLDSLQVWNGKSYITIERYDKIPEPIICQEKLCDIITTPENRFKELIEELK